MWAYGGESEASRLPAPAGWKNSPVRDDAQRARLARTMRGPPAQFRVPVQDREVARRSREVERRPRKFAQAEVGKLVTIYCYDPGRARSLAEALHECLRGLPGPEVPSDLRFRNGSNVFYRYGAYEQAEIDIEGRLVPAYHDNVGNLVPDWRTRATAVPHHVANPFVDHDSAAAKPPKSGRAGKYTAYGVIRWRGSGGVYHARSTAPGATIPLILKEGLRFGEVNYDGANGLSRRRMEKRALILLRGIGIPVPAVVDFFSRDDAVYLVLEKIEGTNVQEMIDSGDLDVAIAHEIGFQLTGVLAAMHKAGWAWGDCKPANLIYDGRQLWVIDMETAIRLKSRPRGFIATRGYFANWTELLTGPRVMANDLYALGVTLHHLFAQPALAETL